MPIYRFNLEDHIFIADRGTHLCEDDAEATEVANEIADRLAQTQPELVREDLGIVVRNQENKQVYRASMDKSEIRRRRGPEIS